MLWASEMDVLLQVTEINDDVLSFDVIEETLRATNLGTLHNVSGHVATTATIASIEETDNNTSITFEVIHIAIHHPSYKSVMIRASCRPEVRM